MKRSRRENFLLFGIVAGVIAGGALGGVWPERGVAVAWVGELFLRALKMLVLPLIFCSMIAAVTGIVGKGNLRRVALTTVCYYVATTFAAVVLGLVVVSVVRPGDGVALSVGAVAPDVARPGGIEAIIDSILSPNLFEAAYEYRILPILVFALVFGMAMTAVGEEARGAVRFFHGCNQSLLKLVDWVMVTAPFGIAALIAARVGGAGGVEGFLVEARAVAYYCFAVLIGLAGHAFVTLPVVLLLLARRNPLRYGANLGSALVTAFATASSSATLAVTMRLTAERNRVSREAANFVLPLGATVNMDGTALYEAVAAMFIAQALGIELELTRQVVIVVTATLASIGAAGIPQAGLVTMVIVLEAVGLPLEGISLILAVDWFLDRCRTSVNVWGDAVGAAVVDARNRVQLHP